MKKSSTWWRWTIINFIVQIFLLEVMEYRPLISLMGLPFCLFAWIYLIYNIKVLFKHE